MLKSSLCHVSAQSRQLFKLSGVIGLRDKNDISCLVLAVSFYSLDTKKCR
jgi:hypothetical protein